MPQREQVEKVDVDEKMVELIDHCLDNNLSHPIEIMKYLQSQLVQGRDLRCLDVSNIDEDLTNFIMIDRAKLENFKALRNKFITLEVQFNDGLWKSMFDIQ